MVILRDAGLMLIANYVDHQTLSLYSPEKVHWENKTQYFRLREAFIKKKEKKMTFVILGGGANPR